MPKYSTFLYGIYQLYGGPLARVYIDGTDRTSYIPMRSISIQEVITNRTATAEFTVLNGSGLSLAEYQTVLITDITGQTRYFAGYIRELRETQSANRLDYEVECVDFAWDLEHPEALINTTYENQNDSAIISNMMGTACPDIEASTYVETVYASIPKQEFDHATAREILDKLASQAGAHWYVDYGPGPGAQIAYLHYFDEGTNSAPYGLSDTPDNVSTFGFEKLEEIIAAPEANKVIVVYRGGTVTRTSGAEEDYGRWITGRLVDHNIETAAQANERGDNFLAARGADPTYRCIVREPGLRAGQTINLVDSSRGISGNYTIQRITTTFWARGKAQYEVEMGKYIPRLPDLIKDAYEGDGNGGDDDDEFLWEEFDDHLHNIIGDIIANGLHDHLWGGLNTQATEHTHYTGRYTAATGSGTSHSHSIGYNSNVDTGSGTSHSHTQQKQATTTWGGPGHEHSYYEPAASTGAEAAHTHKYDKANSPTGGEASHSHQYWEVGATTGVDVTAHYHYIPSDNTDDEPAHGHADTFETGKHDA